MTGKTAKGTKSKKTYKKKKIYKKKKTNSSVNVFRDREVRTLRYSNSDNFVTALNRYKTGIREYFRLNDINRPLFAQAVDDALPTNFGVFDQFFDKFKVHEAYIKLDVSPNITGKNVEIVIQYLNSANDKDITGLELNDLVGTRHLLHYNLPTDKKFTFKKKIRVCDIEGIKPTQFDADLSNYTGQLTTSASLAGTVDYRPKNPCDLVICLINNSDNTIVEIPFTLTIDYKTEFFGREKNIFAKSG